MIFFCRKFSNFVCKYCIKDHTNITTNMLLPIFGNLLDVICMYSKRN